MTSQQKTDVTTSTGTRRQQQPKRWLRFGLRTFLVLVTLLCIGLATLAIRARQQRQLVAAVEGLGGEVRYEWQPSHFELIERHHERLKALGAGATLTEISDHPSGPLWLRRLVGDEYFQQVEEIMLRSPRWSRPLAHKKQLLNLIADAPNLESLFILHSDLVDDDLRVINKLDGLRYLTINGAEISDDGLPLLYGMKNLESLVVISPHLTFGAVLELSKQLPECRVSGPTEGITLLAGKTDGEVGVFLHPNVEMPW